MLVYRKDVKLYHCGTCARPTRTSARRCSTASALGARSLIGTKKAPGPLYGIKGDEWSALAVALTLQAQLEPDLHAMERAVAPLVPGPMRVAGMGKEAEPF
jgi:hypothetical protein